MNSTQQTCGCIADGTVPEKRCGKILTISVCMIVRDEEAALARCLRGVQSFADEIVIVDTGSVDKTKQIALEFTAKIYDYSWEDDFAAARNFSYSLARCDYIMWLDADEIIEAGDGKRIAALKHTLPPEIDVVYMLLRAAVTDNQETAVLRDRLVRRSLGARWVDPVHEGIPMRFVAENGEVREYRGYVAKDITIRHKKETVNDPGRNLRIFEKMRAAGTPFSARNYAYYCRELYIHRRYAEAYEAYGRIKGCQSGPSVPDLAHALPFAVWSLQKLDRWPEASAEICAALTRVANTPLLCCELGNCSAHFGRDDLAEFWYLQALSFSFDPCDFNLVFPAYYAYIPSLKLSKLYAANGRLDKAIEYNERALAARPDSVSATLNRLYFAGLAAGAEKGKKAKEAGEVKEAEKAEETGESEEIEESEETEETEEAKKTEKPEKRSETMQRAEAIAPPASEYPARPGGKRLRLRQFDPGKWNRRPIVLCGTLEKVARAADYLLENHVGDGTGSIGSTGGIVICDDEKAGQRYRNLEIIGAESLTRYNGDNLILGSKAFYQRYMRFLPGMTLGDWFFMSRLLTDPYERKGYENLMSVFFRRRREEAFILPGVDLVLTQRCNLRCRYCANRMQYYAAPRDYAQEDYLESLARLLDAADGIASLRIIGGEPFLLPEKMEKVIECFGGSEQIFCIDIPTNGTLLLPEKTASVLAGCPKATVLVSDYGPPSRRVKELLTQLKEYHISHLLYPEHTPWYDMGDLSRYERTDEETQDRYRDCLAKEGCATLLGSELYLCPVAAHGAALGAVPKIKEEYVDLSDTAYLRERLIRFHTRQTHLEACRYCLGGRTRVPRGEQAPQALPYQVLTENGAGL